MHGPFCHKTWSVLSLMWSILSCGGLFCPWSVLSMVRYVPNSEVIDILGIIFCVTLKCLSIGTPKTINIPFVPNGKLMIFRCPNN